MDFFERQDRARKATRVLIVYFILAVVLIVVAVYAAAVAVIHFSGGSGAGFMAGGVWNPVLFSWVALGTVAVILIASAVKTLQLRRGGGMVAQALGGRLLDPATADLDERRLLNVVEEMAIASGVAVPEVYVLDEENGINAFAAGFSPNEAAIGVTAGCMRLLSRDELQGVIAHEFSHVLNGDMRLNIRLIGLLFGILAIAVIGRTLLRAGGGSRRSRRNKSGGAIVLGGLALLIIGHIGVLFGRLIQSAVSRQREFLADASAVQFTRNPGGIAGALKKIGGLSGLGSRLATPHAEETGHLFFGNALAKSWINWFSTHPPLADRIKAIDPAFDGVFPEVRLPDRIAEPDQPHWQARPKERPPILVHPATAARVASALTPQRLLEQAGNVTPEQVAYASDAVQTRIPGPLLASARESGGAVAIVYGLLLSPDDATRAGQLEQLRIHAGDGAVAETNRLHVWVRNLDPAMRLPLVDLALPALRLMSEAQYHTFSVAVRELIECDREIDLFEYALQRILQRQLSWRFDRAERRLVQYYALNALQHECAVLISALAHIGHADPAAKQRAHAAAVKQLGRPLPWLELTDCNLSQIDSALAKLAQTAPPLRRLILSACLHAVAVDGLVQPREAELMRAIAEALDCPLPPQVA